MKLFASLAAVVVASGVGATAQATTNLVANGAFLENDSYSTLFSTAHGNGSKSYNSNALTNVDGGSWTSTGYNFVFQPLSAAVYNKKHQLIGGNPYGGADQGGGYSNVQYGQGGDDLYLYGYGAGSQTTSKNAFGTAANPLPFTGNFIAGNDEYGTGPYGNGPISQTISGLKANTTYTLTFYEAFAQQAGYNGATEQNWDVCLAGSCLFTNGGTANASTTNKPVTLAGGAFSGWSLEKLTFQTGKSLQNYVLSFQSYGVSLNNKGKITTTNLPPFALLADVDMQAGTPEPATWALMILGIAGVGGAVRRRRAQVISAA